MPCVLLSFFFFFFFPNQIFLFPKTCSFGFTLHFAFSTISFIFLLIVFAYAFLFNLNFIIFGFLVPACILSLSLFLPYLNLRSSSAYVYLNSHLNTEFWFLLLCF